MTSGSVAEQREASGLTDRLSKAVENSASQTLTANHTNRSTFGTSTERSAGWDSGSGWETRSGTDQFDKKSTTRSEEHTSELLSLMRNSYAACRLKKKNKSNLKPIRTTTIVHMIKQ